MLKSPSHCEAPQRGLDAGSTKRAGARVNRFRVDPKRKAVCASSAQRPLSFWEKAVDALRVPDGFRTASIGARGGSAKENELSDDTSPASRTPISGARLVRSTKAKKKP